MDWKKANKVTPAQWKEAIDKVADPMMKAQLASIVFWDFFADESRQEFDKHLGHLMAAWKRDDATDPEALCAALIVIGYPEDLAANRASDNKRVVLGDRTYESNGPEHGASATDLMTAIAIQAVEDIQALVKQGIIVNGQVCWKDKTVLRDYHEKEEVEELVQWVKDGALADLCESCGIKVPIKRMLEALGLTPIKPIKQVA